MAYSWFMHVSEKVQDNIQQQQQQQQPFILTRLFFPVYWG